MVNGVAIEFHLRFFEHKKGFFYNVFCFNLSFDNFQYKNCSNYRFLKDFDPYSVNELGKTIELFLHILGKAKKAKQSKKKNTKGIHMRFFIARFHFFGLLILICYIL